MSASSSPTEAPLLRSAAARLTATVDLPTPPLPEATAIVCLTPGRISEGLGRRKAGRTLAVIRTSTPVTPTSPPTASSAWDLKRSRTGQAGVVSSNVKLTRPCGLTSSSLIMPRLTTSRPRSGSLIVANASSTCCDEGVAMRHRMLPRLLTSMRHEDSGAPAKSRRSLRFRGDQAGDRRESSGGSPRLLRRSGLRRLLPARTRDAVRCPRRRGRRDGILLQQGGHPVRGGGGGPPALGDPPGRRPGVGDAGRRLDGQKGNRAPRSGALLAIWRLRDRPAGHDVELLRLGNRSARDRRS